MNEAAFWAGAAAAIVGGLVTGTFALAVGWIASRTETRRQLARERRVAYASLLAALDRLVVGVLGLEAEIQAYGTSPAAIEKAQDELMQFREAFYAAQIAASPRMLELVRGVDKTTQIFFKVLRRSPSSIDRLLGPFLELMYQIPTVFAEEARYEVEVGAAGWLKQWRLRKVDPTTSIRPRLDATFEEILRQSEVGAAPSSDGDVERPLVDD